MDITVEYAVEDQDGGFNESSFVITLTGTNDAPAVTGILSNLPGGSEDTLYTITKDQLLAGFSDKDSGETATLDIANLLAKDADDNVIGTLTAQDSDGVGVAGVGLSMVWGVMEDGLLQPLVSGDHPLLSVAGLPEQVPGVLTLDRPVLQVLGIPDHLPPDLPADFELRRDCGWRP